MVFGMQKLNIAWQWMIKSQLTFTSELFKFVKEDNIQRWIDEDSKSLQRMIKR